LYLALAGPIRLAAARRGEGADSGDGRSEEAEEAGAHGVGAVVASHVGLGVTLDPLRLDLTFAFAIAHGRSRLGCGLRLGLRGDGARSCSHGLRLGLCDGLGERLRLGLGL
jgi:hypothetical protein